MSNKKQQQPYIGKPAAAVEVGPAPPRYQPPPQPGILKHIQQPPVPLAQTSTNSAPKDVKQHHPYSYRLVPPNTVKQPYNPNVPEGVVKFVPQLPINGVVPHGSKTAYPVPQYPPVGYVINPNQAIPQQHRPVRSSVEDPHAQTQPPALRVQKKEEEFVKTHQRAQEEFLQAPTPAVQGRPPEDFNRGQIVYRTQRLTDEEFLRLTPVEMLKFVRKTENEGARIASEQHRHMQNLVNELRTLKETNQRLSDDNQELRDLCCFLDDDRQKGRKLAREWQRFGRYTASVMRQEVSAYQNKLRELDNKQQELIKDNLELKELCLYLDEERGGSSLCPSCGSASSGVLRDDGDGSSSSTNADEPAVPAQFNNGGNAPRRSASRERFLQDSLVRQRSMFNDQMMQYVRNLEQRVKQLEDEKRALLHKMSQLNCDGDSNALGASAIDLSSPVLTGRPEAVVRALQVLEVREQLERDRCVPDHEQHNVQNGSVETTLNSDMDDGEKALVREMCNVVWRKLEDAPAARR